MQPTIWESLKQIAQCVWRSLLDEKITRWHWNSRSGMASVSSNDIGEASTHVSHFDEEFGDGKEMAFIGTRKKTRSSSKLPGRFLSFSVRQTWEFSRLNNLAKQVMAISKSTTPPKPIYSGAIFFRIVIDKWTWLPSEMVPSFRETSYMIPWIHNDKLFMHDAIALRDRREFPKFFNVAIPFMWSRSESLWCKEVL